ncbi:MAG: tetratricopeptide repeat protein [Rhizomicrobium sp.]|nr:tetratricopeptide repeat protein [Rhizomicrobium sp.]
MSDPNLLFREAGELCEAGNFVQAAELYRRLLTLIPNHPQIMAALGNVEIALGNPGNAISLFHAALAVYAPQPDVWCNLARAQRQAGLGEEALRSVDNALALAPDVFEAWTCRGNVLWDLGRVDDALMAYDHAIALRPTDARAHFNRGNALQKLLRRTEAIESFQRAVALSPRYSDAHRNLALALAALGQYDDALLAIDRVLATGICGGDVHDARGQILHGLGRFDEAIVELSSFITVDPESPLAYNNRGVSLHAAGCLDEALTDFDQAIALDPSYGDAIVNRGTLLKDLGRLDDAAASYEQALRVSPGHFEANWNIGLLALMRGDFATGWSHYEWRWKSKVQAGDYIQTPRPQWRGEDIAGKTILLWWEQGYGDYIQFCRYVSLVAKTGARIILETPPRLRSLMARMEDGITLMEADARQAEFDVHCPLMSLPLAFGTTLDSVPAECPYLAAEPDKVEAFDVLLGPGPRIGLIWSANINNIHAKSRHMEPRFIEALFDLPFSFHIVQKEFGAEDKAWLVNFPHLPVYSELQSDFLDAAALVSSMDLIITVDTSIAHLAGALGKPVWVLLPHVPDWRWMLDREDTPWYPTMRLFRQPKRGDWAGAIAAVRSALLSDFPKR